MTAFRLGTFLGVFVLVALWEAVAPAHRPARRRWPVNLGLILLDSALLRLLGPVSAVAAAAFAARQGWGLLPALGLGDPGGIALVVVAMDLSIWAQHLVMHRVPALWRLHRVHHTDLAFDVTTGIRFHPGEMVISMLWKAATVVCLGATPLAVVVFETLLSAASLFEHANASLPQRLDGWLRRALVTPDMHRIHHSPVRADTDSNYGFLLAVWDRLFRTYRARATGDGIGLGRFRAPADQRLLALLGQPFR
ncbi:MAG: sterol desaturase family protein [Rhodospirillales bacterium]|nr:sterol desaturase family protein [Rhodospirillales bacterium]